MTILREQVDEAVGDGADLGEVEARVLDHAAIGPEARDALWLYAWGKLERDGEPARAGRRRGHRHRR